MSSAVATCRRGGTPLPAAWKVRALVRLPLRYSALAWSVLSFTSLIVTSIFGTPVGADLMPSMVKGPDDAVGVLGALGDDHNGDSGLAILRRREGFRRHLRCGLSLLDHQLELPAHAALSIRL